MNFNAINFDLKIEPTEDKYKVRITYSSRYLTETSLVVDVHEIDEEITRILGMFKGSAVNEVKTVYREQTGLFLQ